MHCSMRLKCPHCKAKAVIRTSREMSSLTVEHTIQCQNVECAHTWVAHTSAVRTIAPSMCPDPTVYIQRSPRSPAAQQAAAAAERNQCTLALEETHHPRAAMALDSS
ncbi:MAG: ogr/Delta-like zinc finger family protein [Georgfuchsia sp.]